MATAIMITLTGLGFAVGVFFMLRKLISEL